MARHSDHFAIDSFGKDSNSGLFAIFDGHGGSEVVEYCAKVTPEVLRRGIVDLWQGVREGEEEYTLAVPNGIPEGAGPAQGCRSKREWKHVLRSSRKESRELQKVLQCRQSW